MANWRNRGRGMKVRYRGKNVIDRVEKTNRGWRITVEDRNSKSVLFGGNRYFRLQRDAIAALDGYLQGQGSQVQKSNSDEREPEQRQIPEGTTTCDSCGGSGKWYGHGYVLNGVFQGPTGKCYPCNGKGYQTDEDRRRNWGYWQNNERRISS
jgi:hypothetical protein